MKAEEEKELIEQARKDPEKFGELFEAHYQTILSYALRRVGDVVLAQDVTANTFLKAYKKLWQFKWRGIPFVAWLYRIAGNEIKSHYRKANREGVSLETLHEMSGFEPEDLHDVEQELIEAEQKLAEQKQFLKVRRLVSSLDEKYQEVLYLRFFEDLKIREIAQILGKREGTIKSLISRALGRLRILVTSKRSVTEDDRIKKSFPEAQEYRFKYKQLEK